MGSSQHRVSRAFVLGVFLLLAGVGGWIFADAHQPTASNALTSSWVLKPRAYDLLRFGSAALAVLGLAALIQAVLIALQASTPRAQATELEAQPRRRSALAFVALGVVLAFAAVGAVTAASGGLSDGSSPASSAEPQTAAVDQDPAEEESSDDVYSSAPDTDSGTAKTNVRMAVSAIESCFTDALDYARCVTPTALGSLADGLSIHEATYSEIEPGEVLLHGEADTYSIMGTDSDGFLWSIVKRPDASIDRLCETQIEGTPCDQPTW